MIIENYVELMVNNSLKVSRDKMGDISYPYTLGYFQSSIQSTLKSLNLNEDQLKILQANINMLKGE